jgi:hypothetical protein
MIVLICLLGSLCAVALYFLGIWRAHKAYEKIASRKDNEFEERLGEASQQAEFMHAVSKEMAAQLNKLEYALSSQLVSRSSEVGSPPPSGAYHTVFLPTGDGKVLMIYICLDTGHVARWHFHSPEALEGEGQRLIKVAQQVRENSLPDRPEILNVHIGNNGTVH